MAVGLVGRSAGWLGRATRRQFTASGEEFVRDKIQIEQPFETSDEFWFK